MNKAIIMLYGGSLSVVLLVSFVFLGLWYQKKVQNASGFLMAGRSVPFWLQASAFIGASVGGASLSGWTGNGFVGGLGTVWPIILPATFGPIFMVLFARRLNFFGRKYDAVTISDFICHRYGERLRLPSALFATLRPTCLTGMQFLSIAGVLRVAFDIPLPTGILISSVTILLYIITAGQYSAVITQWLQGILQTLGMFVFLLAVFKVVGNPTQALDLVFGQAAVVANGSKLLNMFEADLSMISVWFITMGFFYLVDPWIYMFAYIGKTPRQGTSANLLGNFCIMLFGAVPLIAGMILFAANNAAKLNPAVPGGIPSDQIYSWFVLNHAPTGLGVFIIMGLLMTIISCGSSFAMNGVAIFTRDLYQKGIKKDKITEKQGIFAARVSCVIVVLIGIAAALWLPILVPLWSLAQALVISALLAPVLSAWFWKRSTTSGAYWSTILGGATAFAWAMYAWITTGSPASLIHGYHACHTGLIVSIPVMIIVSLATKPEYELAAKTSYENISKMMKEEDPDFKGQTERGLFAWFGAKTPLSKLGWAITCIIPILVWFFYATFRWQAIATPLLWISLLLGLGFFVTFSIVGFFDLKGMVTPADVKRN